ncbi:MAG: hypothetical protein AAGK97_16480, partial [Bacteroidota bacterium]
MTRFFIIIIAGLCIIGCKLDQEEMIPAYIHIPSVEVNTAAGEGANTHKITDVWVYANDNLLGAFPIPATVPILENGDTKIEIFPGIKDNGINSTPELYPMLQTVIQTVNLQPSEIDTLIPAFVYKSNVNFEFVENFENTIIFTFDEDGNVSTVLNPSSEEARTGLRSGKIELNATNNFIEVGNDQRISGLPTNGSPVYLELDYKNTMEFSIGLIGYDPLIGDPSQLIITLREREDWNKVYINLTEQLQLSQFDEYRIFFSAFL